MAENRRCSNETSHDFRCIGSSAMQVYIVPFGSCANGHANCVRGEGAWVSAQGVGGAASDHRDRQDENSVWAKHSHSYRGIASTKSYSVAVGFGTCPSGHANCQAVMESRTIVTVAENRETSEFIKNDEHRANQLHTHTYDRVYSTTIPGISSADSCADNHSNCKLSFITAYSCAGGAYSAAGSASARC